MAATRAPSSSSWADRARCATRTFTGPTTRRASRLPDRRGGAMKTTGGIVPSVIAVVAAALLLAVATPARAQFELGGGWKLEGEVEAGWRFFYNEPPPDRRAKWEEYRDYPGSAFLGDLQLRVFTADEKYSAEFTGSKWGQTDQEFGLRGGRLGLWEAGFAWDQTPHILSTDARLLASQPFRGVFALPNPRPNLFTYNSAPTLDEISVQWDTARMFFTLTPTPDLEITAKYERIFKTGDRPFGVAF